MTKETKVGLVVGLVFMVGVVYLLSWFTQPSASEEQASQYRDQQQKASLDKRLVQPSIHIPLSVSKKVDSTSPLLSDPLLETAKNVGTTSVIVPAASKKMVKKSVLPVQPLKVKRPEPMVAKPRFYIVKKGQNLSDVAEAAYGAAHRQEWRRIYEANKYKVPNEHRIWPGLKLRIPALTKAAPASIEKALGLRAATTYKVMPGDTLSEIAGKRLGSATRWREIMALNRDKLASEYDLQVGMVLKLPGARKTSQPRLPQRAEDIRW